jgi:hypothetical protein
MTLRSELESYSSQELTDLAREAGVIEPGETADDWQLIQWIVEADDDARYQAHCADFYSW